MGELLEDLHVQESKSKACSLGTRMMFLGIVIDSTTMSMELDKNRLHQFKHLLGEWESKIHASLKEIQSLIGVLSFASTCILQGRAFFSRILNFLRAMPHKGEVKIPDEVVKDVLWWKYIAPLYNRVSCIPATFWSGPDAWFNTDTCLSGRGGYFNAAYFHFNFSKI